MCENLKQLTPVDLNKVWETEPQHFTPWLAQEENLTLLGNTLDMELELEAQEINVGGFRADLLCKNTEDDSWVIIENQLGTTDHKHAGQLLTYAAGLDAFTVIWIAKTFRSEYRAMLDWQTNLVKRLNSMNCLRTKEVGLVYLRQHRPVRRKRLAPSI